MLVDATEPPDLGAHAAAGPSDQPPRVISLAEFAVAWRHAPLTLTLTLTPTLTLL